ncbi:ACP S-malonyltransferase [Paenibacillus sp. GSMTC-2017]|uniref:ACP S-malonyltransferase n=1 Tax=Paenibacillus sp. GSMTC-2017 TaxID=2794350 RepID=UPI0018D7569E|nr:ACP S-malonyltransferase [Paenibacillus sp. GSMTC-2017]MBH5320081.1 ACP S-malonyltransferase [Paenibacillus sp. GSMTC-2017]
MNIALLLAGQGTKFSEQVVNLWLANNETLSLIEKAEAQLGEPIREWFAQDLSKDTRKAQLATYVGSMCMYRLYRDQVGLYPSVVLGHSLGELTALTIAGAFDYEAGLTLVELRGSAMKGAIERQEQTGMMALFVASEMIEELLEGNVRIANYNSNKQTVISGPIDEIQLFAKKHKFESVVLNVSGAFHTPYMQQAADEVYEKLEGFTFNSDLSMTVVSNKNVGPYHTENFKEEIANQIVQPVKWKQSIDYAINQGIQLFVDLSPNGMFVNMLAGQAVVRPFHTEEHIKALLTDLKDDIEVNGHYNLYSRALGIIVSTKNNSDDADAYENIVVSGYNQIKSQIGHVPTADDVKKTLSLLKLILQTKEVPEEQINSYCSKLAWKVG